MLSPSRKTKSLNRLRQSALCCCIELNCCRDSKKAPVTRSQFLFNVTRDLNTTELIFEENRKYCNNKGCNMVTNESYCSPLHSEFLG